ncbi:hypothetical protein P0Y35_03405 [Kiritimatiellaeota bacterium B1221]|nr:hypothetical protein [Kiritimatiellaeota bacterium B1221]
MKFTEAQLESANIDLLKEEGYRYISGAAQMGGSICKQLPVKV